MGRSFALSEALDSVAANPKRASLAALGLVIGVSAVIAVLSAGQSVRALIVDEMGPFGRATSLSVMPDWSRLAAGGWKDRPESFDRADLGAIRALPELAGASAVAELQLKARSPSSTKVARIMAVSSDYFAMERLELERGRAFLPDDDEGMRRVAVVGAAFAEELFPGEEAIGKRIALGSFGEVEIVGRLREEAKSMLDALGAGDNSNNGSVFVPFTAAARFGGERYAYRILAEAASAGKLARAQARILSALDAAHGSWADGASKFRIETGKGALEEVDRMTGILTAFISLIAGISLLVAGIGVMNVMLISVKERTREIGTRKALGARPRWIRTQILLESLIVCGLGGAGGVALAAAAVRVVAAIAKWQPIMAPGSILIALSLSLSTALAFGWLPAWRASRMDPVEALRYE